MFLALWKRRNVAIKYERYANAQTAAAVYNVNRGSEDAPILHPMDWVRDDEAARKKEKRDKFKAYARKVIGGLPMTTPMEKVVEVRAKAIKDLEAAGCKDAVTVMDSVWPHLKEQKE